MAAEVLSEADLHGLVDGNLDADRRADVLRRAAASPRDRALVEAWQDQNDLIRAAFAGVEHEPIPSTLDLRRPPQLHAMPLPALEVGAQPPRWRRAGGLAATIVVVTAGLAGSWFIAGRPDDPVASIALAPVVGSADLGERMLADRTMSALAFGEIDPATPSGPAEPPPTSSIPDLSSAGFTFLGAEARGISPRYVVFRYRDRADGRIAIGMAHADIGDVPPARREAGFTWRSGRISYAVFGTVSTERLRAVVGSLHDE